MFPPTKCRIDSAKQRDLEELGQAMRDRSPKNVFTQLAGVTYLGQFIDHDITHDRTKLEELRVEPSKVPNFRTPRLDLEHIYGKGPKADGSPQLYECDGSGRLLVGPTAESILPPKEPNQPPTILPGGTPRDFHRINGEPQIADKDDPRDLENLFVAQIHVLFMKFHNLAMKQCFDKAFERLPLPSRRFERAQQLVRWHYQRLVHRHFLSALLDNDVFNDIYHSTECTVRWHERGFFIPAEFSLAAFRFGHSMVRNSYVLNCHHDGEVSLRKIMEQSHKYEDLPEHWLIEWGRLFPWLPKGPGKPTPSESINTAIVPELHNLDEYTKRMFSARSSTHQPSELPVRTLLRGARAGLPSGQEVAAILIQQNVLKSEDVLSRDQLLSEVAATNDNSRYIVEKHTWMQSCTPLYYYLLKEAEVKGEGGRLGPVGSRIVGEVILRILREDRQSYLNKVGVNWKLPSWKFLTGLPRQLDSISDLVELVGDGMPQGCNATISSTFLAALARLAAQWTRFESFIGWQR